MKPIMSAVHAGKPIGEDDLRWLGTKGKCYWTEELRLAHHHNLAKELTEEWRREGDHWTATNASSQWRKAQEPKRSLRLTEEALPSCPTPKLRSALCTTRGGAMRDLRRFDEAVDLGDEAHALTPGDFRPCTLLGAVHIQKGNYSEGAEWYEKAETLGASSKVIDREYRSILAAAAPEERKQLASFLKARDHSRFGWA